jgi:putative modified peptide
MALTPEQVDKLLEKLSSDDQFREDFKKDPEAALGQLGAAANPQRHGCWPVKRLASKDEIGRTREKLKEKLLGLNVMAPECLGAST